MADNNATVKSETIDGAKYSAVTFTLQNKYKVVGYISAGNMVDRVQTWIANDVFGDMLVEGVYRDYKDFSGVKFPTMIIEKQGGFPVLILVVSDVKPNAAVNIPTEQRGDRVCRPYRRHRSAAERAALNDSLGSRQSGAYDW